MHLRSQFVGNSITFIPVKATQEKYAIIIIIIIIIISIIKEYIHMLLPYLRRTMSLTYLISMYCSLPVLCIKLYSFIHYLVC